MPTNETLSTTLLDKESIPQGKLDIENRVRTNLLPWLGQFSPQLVEELLMAHGKRAEVILDPFAGSGTSLVEAARLGKAAWGADINPAAVILARVYQLVNSNPDERETLVNCLEHLVFQAIEPPNARVFLDPDAKIANRAELESALIGIWNESAPGISRILASALVILCDFHRRDFGVGTIYKTWTRLAKIIRTLPISTRPILVHQADARALPIESNSVELVLTSPPYINVHNYHQKFRRSVEALGWNVLDIAPSEIGSNRQNRGNRFLTVIQYSLDMVLALREMSRVAKSGTSLILVLGRESTVRGVPFFNGTIIAELATQGAGMVIERRQERRFANRYGSNIREDILHFRTYADIPDYDSCLEAARSVAGQALLGAWETTNCETRQGIQDALDRIHVVSPSPIPTTESLTKVLP